ncbi:MAG: VOC family protein [Chloroflexi bacterium]|nr:VOC family protein [Chloroflexota bacterium]
MTPAEKRAMEEKRDRLRRWVPEDGRSSVTQGINHVAVYCKDMEETARFYTEAMGMPVINVIDNRDVPESTHMNVDVGNGMALSFFDFPHISRLQEFATEGVGNVMHIALPITPARYAEVKARLDEGGTAYEEVGGSLYVKDPNRLGIELLPMD